MSENIEKLRELIAASHYAVFFGGAGVSTESGIPDFRSSAGLGARQYKYPFEYILSHEFFFEHADEFYDYYFAEMTRPEAQPNAAHIAVAALEKAGKLKAVVTQNIDGLHQAAGSRNVYELHGSVHRNRCTRCGKRYDGLDAMLARRPLPRCDCGGLIKPDVVLYGEPLDEKCVAGAVAEIAKSDLVIVGGTSLAVYPAAGFLGYARGKIVVINRDKPVSLPARVVLEIRDGIGKVLSAAVAGLLT